MDELSIKIIMILFPGIITTMLLDKITEHKPWDNFKYSIFIIFYGVMSYAILQLYYIATLFYEVGKVGFDMKDVKILNVWDFNNKEIKEIPYQEIIKAGFVSFLLGLFISYIDHKEYFSSLLLKLGLTSKYGNYSTNYQLLKLKRNDWIDVTIWDKDLFIRGIVVSINETDGFCELCIHNAEVFIISDNGMDSIYKVDYISLSEKPDNLLISTTQQPTNGGN
ncbi:hypothetical protein [Frederiksenia canicola]|uniref:Uncharacterized protein n=1 Tax=Frederiksenia canicola TaxID=123824 RepID=A0AAE6X5A1_9PAST|nr:hypothetical protein [Frederiksenia canicola]QIM64297.1 hypothetical protein A4G17_01920 [Frederiksenia canicola]RPE93842.1 hypothetical protein EDC49_1357 [Frederiksenia canicola]